MNANYNLTLKFLNNLICGTGSNVPEGSLTRGTQSPNVESASSNSSKSLLKRIIFSLNNRVLKRDTSNNKSNEKPKNNNKINEKSKKNNKILKIQKKYNNILSSYAGYFVGDQYVPSTFSREISKCARSGAFEVDLLTYERELLSIPEYNSNSITLLIHASVMNIAMGKSFDDVYQFIVREEPCCIWSNYFDQELYNMLFQLYPVVKSAVQLAELFGTSNSALKVFDILVGVEPNPGPEKHEKRASYKMRSRDIQFVLKEKNLTKNKTLQLKELRDYKYQVFYPEGFFEVGIDSTSKEFLETLMGSLTSKLQNLKIPISIEMNPPQYFVEILKWISNLTKDAKDLIMGFVRLIVYHAPKKVCEFYNTLCLFVFPTGVVPMEEYFECQMKIPSISSIPTTPFYMALYHESFAKAVEERSWSRFITTLAEIKKCSGTHNTAFSVFTSVVREIITFVNDTFGLNIPGFSEPTELTGIVERMNSMTNEFRSGLVSEYAFAERAFTLQDEMETMLYSKRLNLEPIVKDRLTYMLRKFQPIISYCEKNINPNNGPRIEPLAILIAGPSGVGKSTVTVPFLLALMNNILPAEKRAEFLKNHNDFMFFRANENEFWDGYKMRNVAIVYDDFGQQKDTAGNPNPDAFELIRLKNTAPYHLHFASMEDKQRNYAAPKMIFATSNRSKLHFESIVANEAVIRRFDLSFVQVPKLEYCLPMSDCNYFSRKLDLAKVAAEFPYDPSKPETFAELSIVEFIEWDFYRGEPMSKGRTLSFDGLLKLAIASFKKLENKGDSMLKFHEFMKTYVPEMDEFHECEKELSQIILDWCRDSTAEIAGKYPRSLALCDKFNSALRYLIDSETVRILACIVGSCAALLGVLKVFSAVYNTFLVGHPHIEGGTGYNKGEKPRQHKPRKAKVERNRQAAKTAKELNISTITHQSALSTQASVPNLDAYLSIFKRNSYQVEVRGAKLGFCLFFSARHFMWPRHFTEHIMSLEDLGGEGDEWCELIRFIEPFSQKVAFTLDFNKDIGYSNMPDRTDLSLCFVETDKIRSHKSLLESFPSVSQILNIGSTFDSQMMVERSKTLVSFATTCTISDPVLYKNKEGFEFSSRGICYSAPTAVGDCGSFLLVNDTKLNKPLIFGVHTAGTTGGFARNKNCAGVLIFREELRSFIDDCEDCPEFDEEPVAVHLPEGKQVTGFSTLMCAEQPRMPIKSKIEKSPMNSMLWENTTKPAHLRPFNGPNGLIDPSEIARGGYSHDEVFLETSILDEAEYNVGNLILRDAHIHCPNPRVLSYESAILGENGVEFIDSINRSTSPGYPFVLSNAGYKGKRQWFGDDTEFDLSGPKALEVKARVDHIISEAIKGRRLNHIFVDYLKDERRPIAKADIGKTRQIMACPMDLLIAMKMYFGDFVKFIMDRRIHNGVAIGIDCYSEWTSLANYLQLSPEYKVTAGDYSKYDARIPVGIGLRVLSIVEKFYHNSSPSDIAVRRVLFQEIINSKHLSNGVVYEFFGGNPSGQPMTSVYNSICNLLILAFVGKCNLTSLDHDVPFEMVFSRTRFQVFGDDNLVSYHPDDAEIWSQAVLEKSIPIYIGMDYTSELKDGILRQARHLSQVQFLKRGFRFDRGEWMCPLEISVLRETLGWQHHGCTEDEMKQRIECVLSELARHGKGVFDEHASKILKASQACYSYGPKNSTFRAAIMSSDSLEA